MKHKQFIKGLVLWLIVWILAMVFFPLKRTKAEAPELPLKEQSIEKIVTHFANEYEVDSELLLKVMECESHGNPNTVGDGGRSRGIFQIQKPTWDRFTKGMGETLDYTSSFDQAKVAAWAFANGKAGEWTTYVAIQKGGTYSFYSRQLQKHFTVKCSL
jgi:hypothetical protein